MNRRNRRRRKGKSNKIKWAVGVFLTMLLLCTILYMTAHFLLWNQGNSPEEVLISYMNCISEQKYNEMYEMIDVQNSGNISQEDFVQRNSAIYEGIEVRNMKIQITEYKEAERTVYYESSFDTIAGSVSFDNEAVFTSDKDGYKLVWHFILGMSEEQWTALNEDENQPLYNRFRQVWCPGSSFKPVVAAIGLKTNTIDPNEDFGNEGLSWQKDSSWGSYEVTTLHEYEPVIMKNALIYSDNIYFAKAALKIGADNLMNSLDEIGFNQEVPFEITMAESQYSNTDRIETEIQLADSGYGQGQILVNPLHLASIYTSFLNEGNIIQPYLQYSDNPAGKIWIKEAFSSETVSQVMEGLTGVVNDPNGTGYAAHRDDILFAGKTGTAELKESQEDTSGTEIGWFAVFTADKNVETPILMLSMVENVKGIGGSGYVVSKDKAVLDQYFAE